MLPEGGESRAAVHARVHAAVREGPGAHNNAHHVREFRRAVREENAEAYVLGEHFSEATRWLQGEQEDGAMNYYGFAQPVRAWLAERDLAGEPAQLSTPELERWLSAARARVPYEKLHEHYRRLIGWRKQRMEWRHGAYQTLAISDDALLFARYVDRSVTLVAVNRGADPVELPLRLAELPVEVAGWRDAGDGVAVLADRVRVGARDWGLWFGNTDGSSAG